MDADLTYGQPLENNEFILRDFATLGDAIRIKLPHLQTTSPAVRNQYLWIENHQILPQSVESISTRERPKGIRFNIQIGNDRLDGDFDRSRTNYLVPLSAYGNHDFRYFGPDSATGYYDAYAGASRSNPFTGNHPLMLPAIDINGNDSIQAKEFITIDKIHGAASRPTAGVVIPPGANLILHPDSSLPTPHSSLFSTLEVR